MGCLCSKSNGATGTTMTHTGGGGGDAGAAVEETIEIGLDLTDSDLEVLAKNPLEVSKEAAQDAVSTVGRMFRGVRPQLKLTFPLALVGRCIMNKMIDSTKHTDVGRVVEQLLEDDISTIKEGVNVLRSEPLKTAADQLKGLLRKVPRLMAMKRGKVLNTEMDVLLNVARDVRHDADKAFNTVRRPGEKIVHLRVERFAGLHLHQPRHLAE